MAPLKVNISPSTGWKFSKPKASGIVKGPVKPSVVGAKSSFGAKAKTPVGKRPLTAAEKKANSQGFTP